MRDHPHLPLLSLGRCFAIFALASLTLSHIAELTGYSRQALYFWRTGARVPKSRALNKVSTLAFQAMQAMRQRKLPARRRMTTEEIKEILDPIDLATLTTEVMPKSWRPENNE